MKKYIISLYVAIVVLNFSCKNLRDSELVYETSFEDVSESKKWYAEIENNFGEVFIDNGCMDINVKKGVTVWFKEKLTAPIKIEYTVVVVDKGGDNDRVSDFNCFFMALDPRCPGDIFSCTDSIRTGNFGTYHSLRTYYVGYGGNNNTTTRMRRYPGYTRERPMLPEHDLGPPYTIEPNTPIKVQITVLGNTVTYSHDDEVIFELEDQLPYHEGWFAFRTVRNHMQILDFKVTRLNELIR